LSCQENSLTSDTHPPQCQLKKPQVYLQDLILKMTDWPSVLFSHILCLPTSLYICTLPTQNQSNRVSLGPRLHCAIGSQQTNCARPALPRQSNSSGNNTTWLILGGQVSCLCSRAGSQVLAAGICSLDFLAVLTADCGNAVSGNANTLWLPTSGIE